MILDGEEIVKNKIVENLIFSSQQQPAGVDLTIKEIYEFEEAGVIDGDNVKRKLPKTKKIEWDKEGKITLKAGAYKVIFNEIVNVPEDTIAIAQSRSSLLRCGAAILNAIWDPGYSGRSEALVVIFNPSGIIFYKNAKVVQLVFIKMQKKAKTIYKGKYQNENK